MTKANSEIVGKTGPYVSSDGTGTIVHCRSCGCPDFEAHRKNGTIGVRCQGCLLPLLVVTIEDQPHFKSEVVKHMPWCNQNHGPEISCARHLTGPERPNDQSVQLPPLGDNDAK